MMIYSVAAVGITTKLEVEKIPSCVETLFHTHSDSQLRREPSPTLFFLTRGSVMIIRGHSRTSAELLPVVVVVAVCQTPYYALQWVAVAMQRDVAAHSQQGARVKPPPAISQLYALVVANMFSQILVFVSSCCNPIIHELDPNHSSPRLSTIETREELFFYVLLAFAIIYGLLNDNFRTSLYH